MKKIFLFFLLFFAIDLLTRKSKIEGQIVQAHELRRGLSHIYLYGDNHIFNKDSRQQNEYLEKTLTQTQAPVITETPELQDLPFYMPCPYEFIKQYMTKEKSPINYLAKKQNSFNNIFCVENRTFHFTTNLINGMLAFAPKKDLNTELDIKKLKKNEQIRFLKKMPDTFNDIFQRIQEIIADLEEEFETCKKFIWKEEIEILAEHLQDSKEKILELIDYCENKLREQSEDLITKPIAKIIFDKIKQYNTDPEEALKTINLIKKINRLFDPNTRQLLNFKIIFEIYKKQVQGSSCIAVFTGFNHSTELAEIFTKLGYSEIKKIKKDYYTPVPLETFDWILQKNNEMPNPIKNFFIKLFHRQPNLNPGAQC